MEVRVATQGLESAVRWLPDNARKEPCGISPELQRALRALTRCVECGSGVALLDGTDGAGKSSGLRELIRRLPPVFRVVRLAGDALSRAELSGRILEVLGAQQGRDTEHLVALHAARLRTLGRSLVLLVDDADALPEETVRWLASLVQPHEGGVRVVLATRAYAALLDALVGVGICVDLVRLDAAAVATPALGSVDAEPPPSLAVPHATPELEPAPAARAAPPEHTASAVGAAHAQEPLAASDLAAPPPSGARAAPPSSVRDHDGSLTVEELMGTERPPLFEPDEPDESDAAARGTANSRRLPEEPQSPRPVRESKSDARSVGFSPAAAPPQSASAPTPPDAPPTQPTIEPRAQEGDADRRALPHPAHWWVAVCAAGAAAVWLALPALWGRPAAPVSSPQVAEPLSSRVIPVAAARSRAATADRAADPTSRGAGAVETVAVSDLRHAFELLGARPVGDSHVAAVHFLREHGPDSEGYALLDELEARRPDDPAEAANLLAARSRVRAALCAAWADDARGEAPGRLGCPGAPSATR